MLACLSSTIYHLAARCRGPGPRSDEGRDAIEGDLGPDEGRDAIEGDLGPDEGRDAIEGVGASASVVLVSVSGGRGSSARAEVWLSVRVRPLLSVEGGSESVGGSLW